MVNPREFGELYMSSSMRDAVGNNVVEEIRKYLAGINTHRSVVVEDDTDLIESGVLTSLKMMELIVLIEGLRGSAISLEDIDIEKLRTLKDIRSNYLVA